MDPAAQKTTPHPLPGPRFREALFFAAFLHADQRRKGSDVPYVAHLMSVCALVLEHGGDEDLAVAALLHDAVEDQGGAAVLEQLRRRFGQRVADVVAACSDTDVQPKPPWRQRKERYLAHLQHATSDALLVSLCDKVHNARSIREDLRRAGADLWDRFKGGHEGTLWYYRSLLSAFRQRGEHAEVVELLAEAMAGWGQDPS